MRRRRCSRCLLIGIRVTYDGRVRPLRPDGEYLPFGTEGQVAQWPLVCEELVWSSRSKRDLPALRVMAHRRRSRRCTVFVGGLNGRWSNWLPMLQAMVDLQIDPGAIFVLDFSETRFPATIEDLRDVCDDVLGFVSSGGYEELDLVGHSTGGCLCSFMCTLKSDRVRVTNLYSIAGMFVSLFDASHLSLRASLNATPAARSLAKLRVIAKGGAASTMGLRAIARSEGLSRYFLAGLYARPADVPSSVLQNSINSFNVQTLRDTLDIGYAYDYRDVYPRIGVEVRLVVGDHDPLVTEADARDAQALVPHLSFHVLKQTGHFAHLERPVETVRRLYLEEPRVLHRGLG